MLVLLVLIMYYHWQVVMNNCIVILKSNTLLSPFQPLGRYELGHVGIYCCVSNHRLFTKFSNALWDTPSGQYSSQLSRPARSSRQGKMYVNMIIKLFSLPWLFSCHTISTYTTFSAASWNIVSRVYS